MTGLATAVAGQWTTVARAVVVVEPWTTRSRGRPRPRLGFDGINLHGLGRGGPSVRRQRSRVGGRDRVVLAQRECERSFECRRLRSREAVPCHALTHPEDEDVHLRG
ncbi:hypothetical protein PF011_g27439, partial [Phytophthora fragariae]